ncbi:hypothetical protein [Tautonia sociabilis]|uniref:DUF8091 domain-containing protein n=1 Tax=Tautonia sociabilis TaxID=2080755 RepID=A0A432MHM3_9BACT|nr:hypothetical protein [Tautonia sociabilis]RUL86323.1 hypothetical protein TsocGM_16490 [Tautonia sociabilis]
MASSLHRAVKGRSAGREGGGVEVRIGPDRVDAIADDGRLVEVQCGPTSALRPKLGRLLPDHRMRVVLPVIVSRRIVRRSPEGAGSARLSPKKGSAFDAFEHLVGLAGMLAHPNLELRVLEVEVDEHRAPARGRRGFVVVDRALRAVGSERVVDAPAGLWALLPEGLPEPFTTRDLAVRSGRPEWLARRAAYCLRVSGAAVSEGHRNRFRVDRAAISQREEGREGHDLRPPCRGVVEEGLTTASGETGGRPGGASLGSTRR